jgi:peptidoglycan-associated lipoprotein
MTSFFATPSRKLALAVCTAALLVSVGCASRPKPVPPAAGNTPAPVAEAAPTARPAPSPEVPQTLPPIAPAQPFSDGENRGLTPQPMAANATQVARAAATLGEAGDRIFFMTDRSDLTDEARATLARQAAWISANPSKRVIIAGSADERGTREYNLALGSRRAAATRDYLVSLGVSAAAIETISYGKERPIDARSNPEGWAVNRNALTQLLD